MIIVSTHQLSRKSKIIIASSTIIKFFLKLDFGLLLTEPQLKHVATFISIVVLKGYIRKIFHGLSLFAWDTLLLVFSVVSTQPFPYTACTLSSY
jgi:hypothetical protein